MIRASISRALMVFGGLLAALPGVGNAQQTASDYSVCFVAVSRSLRDWDRNCQQCQPYIGEAMRRGLSVERCMQLFDRRDHAAAGPPRPAAAAAPAPVPLVAVVQQLLAALGLNPGPADGVPGPQTEAAVRAFQRAQGLPETGVINEELRQQLQALASRRAPNNNDGYQLASAGTGFYISAKGTVVTNEHVVRGCKRIGLAKRGIVFGSAQLFAVNRQDDLAILTTNQAPPAYLKLRVNEPLKVAEQVLAFGYPLAPTMLSSLGNTTIGNVTALAGLQDNYRVFQLSAPLQPGNSGGPVVDMQGRLVGVVVATIPVAAVYAATRMLPQNVNFAVKGTTLIGFLEAQGVAFEPAEPGPPIEATRVAEVANDASVLLACYK